MDESYWPACIRSSAGGVARSAASAYHLGASRGALHEPYPPGEVSVTRPLTRFTRTMQALSVGVGIAMPVAMAGALPPPRPVAVARANDNRAPAGRVQGGVLVLSLEVRRVRWRPEGAGHPSEIVEAFVEPGRPAAIPGPLIRVPAGTMLDLRLHNPLATPLVIHGLHTRPGAATDSVVLAPRASRRLRFSAGAPGTYFYWGSTTGADLEARHGIDSQLSGAFIVDAPGAPVPTRDRVFVMGVWGMDVDSAGPKPWLPRDMMVINGVSWPHTERFDYAVGDSVRWRWVNPTRDAHPMHLHGFYFGVESRGAWAADTLYTAAERRLAVTETMLPGGTMTMTWSPERAGQWLFHCHFAFHVSPYLSLAKVPDPADPDGPGAMGRSAHDMRGLVLGITVRDRAATTTAAPSALGTDLPVRRIRLLARMVPKRFGATDGYEFAAPDDSLAVPLGGEAHQSPTLVLRRGQPVEVTVVNHLRAATAVHWHGIEVQDSYADGVPEWSGVPGRLAPAIAPGDSFVAAFTPMRAGTFIYHSHSNEDRQIAGGLYGALLVLEPGVPFDPAIDRVVVVGGNGADLTRGRLNGDTLPPPMALAAGRRYRFRLISINPDWRVTASLRSSEGLAVWRALAKDGAELPPSQAVTQPATVRMGPGETVDVEVIVEKSGALRLEIATQQVGWTVSVPIVVRPP